MYEYLEMTVRMHTHFHELPDVIHDPREPLHLDCRVTQQRHKFVRGNKMKVLRKKISQLSSFSEEERYVHLHVGHALPKSQEG